MLLPHQMLIFSLSILNLVEDLLEKKVTNIITFLTTIPSYLFENTLKIVSYPFSKTTKPKEESQNTTADGLLVTIKSTVLTGFHTCETYMLATLLFPIKIFLFGLKISQNLIRTALAISDSGSGVESSQKASEYTSMGNYMFDLYAASKEVALYYANFALKSTGTLISQLFDLVSSIPRHCFNVVKTILKRCQQALLLSILVTYSIGEYLIIYVMFLFSILFKSRIDYKQQPIQQDGSLSGKFEIERRNLREEIKFEEKCAQYKQEIEKLNESQRDIGQNSNTFNNERKKLQDEIQRLQKLIAEVQKESEEENKLKKQEAINLDNERNQLQEQIQNLQQQVVNLQKQREKNALNYEESFKEQESEFEEKRRSYEEKISKLEEKVAELEQSQKEGNANYLNNHSNENVQLNNTDDDKAGVRSSNNPNAVRKQSLQTENIALKEDLDLTVAENNQIKTDADKLKENLMKVAQENNENNRIIVTLQSQLNQVEKDKQILTNENASLKDEIKKLNAEIEVLKKPKRPLLGGLI
ncbi:hypothetical protein FQR65_LT06440 [Abscondita terminalis]|nr:hypothetical protein FQR65_LT06440 [Abscondita terminalis]